MLHTAVSNNCYGGADPWRRLTGGKSLIGVPMANPTPHESCLTFASLLTVFLDCEPHIVFHKFLFWGEKNKVLKGTL